MELVGVDELHAAFLNESRTRGRIQRSVQETRGWHYCMQLLQFGLLLLKNHGGFLKKKYAHFKRRFSKNAFIDSFGGGFR